MKYLLHILVIGSILCISCSATRKVQSPEEELHKMAIDSLPKGKSWFVKLNNRQVLASATENEETNKIIVKKAELDGRGSLDVDIPSADNDMVRSFIVMNESRNEVWRKEKTDRISISYETLRQLMEKNNPLKFYSLAIPSDPALAATVRVRPRHLFTLQIQ